MDAQSGPRICCSEVSRETVHIWLKHIISIVLIQVDTQNAYILREKSLAIYFGDSQFRRNRTFNFIVSKIYVDKRSQSTMTLTG